MAETDNRPVAEVHMFPQIVANLTDTPWAIRESALAAILDLTSGHRFTAEEFQARIGSSTRRSYQTAGKVAVIPLYGVITPKPDMMSQLFGGTSVTQFKASLEAALADDKVDSILVDIDSPGGSTDLIPEMAQQIRQARKTKPIVAVANTSSASAAYWLGSQASEFVVTPSGSVGSIGVFAAHQDVSEAAAKAGVKTTLVSAGKFKTELTPFTPLSDDARAEIQSKVDKFYGMFVQDVARGRATTVDAVRDGFGQGRMVTARDAVKAGMVDRVDTFDNVLAYMEKGVVTAQRLEQQAVALEQPVTEIVALQMQEAANDPPDEPTTHSPTFEAAISGLSFADESDTALTHVSSFVARAQALTDLRRGQGRNPYSAAARDVTDQFKAALIAAVEDLDATYAGPDDPDRTAVAAKAELERLRFIQGATA